MGYAISWLAVQGKAPQQVLDCLGLARTGRTAEIPEAPITSAVLPDGWFLVFANRFSSPLVSEKVLKPLSAGCQVISCQVEEHVMFSSASCYADGALSWHVEHDAQENIYHLASRGALPAEFDEIHLALKEEQDKEGGEQAKVDYIHDAPIALAEAITSFRHDQHLADAQDEPFEVLQAGGKSASAIKPWWKFW